MSKSTSTVKMLIPVTSLEEGQGLAISSSIRMLRAAGIEVNVLNMDMKPLNCIFEHDSCGVNVKFIDAEKKSEPSDLVPSTETANIEVCNPETVCAENCAGLPDCQRQN